MTPMAYIAGDPDGAEWREPDFAVMRLHRPLPPPLPLGVFGRFWGQWIAETAEAAACPQDYVAALLLTAASVLVGNARWAQAWPGWTEPPHLWFAVVGNSGSGKSPGADCLLRDVLPELERRMQGDYPDRLREWKAEVLHAEARQKNWQSAVRVALRNGAPPPPPPPDRVLPPEPQAPRLVQNDVTIEKIAMLLATACPKGLLIFRDEIAGWMGPPGDTARSFWLECYGGRPYRVERQKYTESINIPRLAVGLFGGTQPPKLTRLLHTVDDGLLARIAWVWPEPVEFRLAGQVPQVGPAIECLDKLRLLEPSSAGAPIPVVLTSEVWPTLEQFGRQMRNDQKVDGPMAATIGKARGLVLRLALVLELLRWCGNDGMEAPPVEIGGASFQDAVDLVTNYFLPMAWRVFGESAASQADRSTAALARWILRTEATEMHVRVVQRAELHDLRTAEDVKTAADKLVAAGWLKPPPAGGGQVGRTRQSYPVNPRVLASKPKSDRYGA
jgi:hypothetical protein